MAREQVREAIAQTRCKHCIMNEACSLDKKKLCKIAFEQVDSILNRPDIAIVDRTAKLPENPFNAPRDCADEEGIIRHYIDPKHEAIEEYKKLLAGWVKEVKE